MSRPSRIKRIRLNHWRYIHHGGLFVNWYYADASILRDSKEYRSPYRSIKMPASFAIARQCRGCGRCLPARISPAQDENQSHRAAILS
jgi:hypothetical protein